MRRWSMMVGIGCLGMLALICVAAAGGADEKPEEFVIDDYSFRWNICQVGEAHLRIFKDEDSAVVTINKGLDDLYMTAASAEAVGGVLARAPQYYAKMKGAKEKVDEVKAGGYAIMFVNTAKTGFIISVQLDKQSPTDSVMLNRKAARLFARHMVKAKAMVAYVNRKINP